MNVINNMRNCSEMEIERCINHLPVNFKMNEDHISYFYGKRPDLLITLINRKPSMFQNMDEDAVDRLHDVVDFVGNHFYGYPEADRLKNAIESANIFDVSDMEDKGHNAFCDHFASLM